MENQTEDKWYYVIAQYPDSPKQEFVGFSDAKNNETFLPVFNSKEEGTECCEMIPQDLLKGKHQVQAVIESDLISLAKENNYNVYLLDAKGAIKDQIV